MATPPLFKFFLKSGLSNPGLYYTANEQGIVSPVGTKTPLRDSPRGWDSITKKWGRDINLFGVIDTITSEVDFQGDGAAILKSILYANGMCNYDADILFRIEKRVDDDPTRIWQYDLWYEGKILFPNVEDGGDNYDTFFKVPTVRQGLPELYASRKDIEYDLFIDNDGLSVYNDGTLMANTVFYGVTNGTDPGQQNGNHLIEALIQNTESFPGLRDAVSETRFNYGNITTEVYDQGRYIFIASSTGSLVIDYVYDFITTPASGVDYTADTLISGFIRRRSGSNTSYYTVNEGSSATYLNHHYVLTGQFSIPIIPGDQVYFLTFLTPGSGGTPATAYTYGGTSLKLQFNSLFPASINKGYRYFDYGKKLVSRMTDGQYSLRSNFLSAAALISNQLSNYTQYDGYPYYTIVTSGNAIRQIFDSIKGSLTHYIKDCCSRWQLGVGIEGDYIVIEPLSYFFQRGITLGDIGEIANTLKIPAADTIFNTFSVGYPDQNYSADYNAINGRDEVMSTNKYSLRVSSITQDKDLTSPYRADPHGIEFTRAYLFRRDTTDVPADNTVFLMQIENGFNLDAGHAYYLKRYGASSNTNVLSPPTIYNIGLRPSRFALRWIPYFKSILNIPDGVQSTNFIIDFQTGLKNAAATTTLSSTQWSNYVIKESANIFPANVPVAYAQPKLFIPLYYEFDASLPNSLVRAIEANPYGRIFFSDSAGQRYAGFIMDVAAVTGVDNNNNTYKMKLLAAPSLI